MVNCEFHTDKSLFPSNNAVKESGVKCEKIFLSSAPCVLARMLWCFNNLGGEKGMEGGKSLNI